jgi:hypothetical protein
MRALLIILILAVSGSAFGQGYLLRGEILDEKAQPLPSAAAVLLDPADSTLLYFSIAGNKGSFEMRNIKKGSYLLQVSILGYKTSYNRVTIPLQEGDDIGQIIMAPKVYNINEVTVNADRIPMRIKKDTIEYDAKAYKVKADGVAEDLIRKLPGVEVDRAGNIKALGEDVKNVLVDGKEFFGNDPKVATRNLPADAINKVQLFDKQTDESEFTGIDDGERNQTLNLVLDKDKKQGIFGDVMGGLGTDDRAQASGKLYRFTEKSQFAGIGMYNNINELGFSMGDYINFSGGMSSFSQGDGHFIIGGENSFPVNFGQPVYGKGSNGAAGLNFSIFNSRKDRFFISYLGNGSKRILPETSRTRNYLPGSSFLTDERKNQLKTDTTHRLNFGARKRIGEKQNVIVNGVLSYNGASNALFSSSESFQDDIKINGMQRSSDEISSRLTGNADASYLLKINEGKTIFKLSGRGGYSGSNSESRLNNITEYLNPYRWMTINQFYDVGSKNSNYSGAISLTQKITKRSFIDFSLSAGYSLEDLERTQGDLEGEMLPVPALSPDLEKTEKYVRPGLTWKRSTLKSNLSVALLSNIGQFTSVLNNDEGITRKYSFLNPRASWEYNYKSGRRLMLDYNTSVNTPRASQLMPVVNNINPLSLFFGNRELKPEYMHDARLSWWLFDQFSFTTLLASVNMRYTADRIGYSRNIDADLRQTMSLMNVKNDRTAGGMIDFTTAIKSLGMKINLVLDESYNRNISLVNDQENINNSLSHRISMTLGNRKKEKWDIEGGSAVTLRSSKYSVQKMLNDRFHDISVFTEVRYTPGVRFNLMGSADITNYSSRSFSKSQLVPLVNAEVNYYILKNQRGVFTIAGVDLLNRNTGIERISELNTLVERQSFIIGRYFMLSFKYRLNKVGDNKGGIDIQVKSR